MKYVYIGKEYQGDDFRERITGADSCLNKWLELIILREEPYLADGLRLEDFRGETVTLLKLCRFFSAIMRDENPIPLSPEDWTQEFAGSHHGLMVTYLNFIRRIYPNRNKFNT